MSRDSWAWRPAGDDAAVRCGLPGLPRLTRGRAERDGTGIWYDPLAELVDLLCSATYAELNKPQPKSMAVRAFPELGKTPVKAGGLQVVAGVREFMDLVVAKEYGHDGASAYYRYLARQMMIKPRGSDEAKELWKSR